MWVCEFVICFNTKVNAPAKSPESQVTPNSHAHTVHTHFHQKEKKKKRIACKHFSAVVRLCFVVCPLIHPSPPIPDTLQMLPPTDSQSRTKPTPNHHYKQPQRRSDTPRQRGSRRRRRRRAEEWGRRGINAIPEISMHMSKGVIKNSQPLKLNESAAVRSST